MSVLKQILFAVVGIALLQRCSSEDVFVTDPRNVSVLQYDTVVLECELAYAPNLGPYWLKGAAVITDGRKSPNDKYEVVGTGMQYNLHILNVTLEEEAKYKCQVHTDDGQMEQEHYVTVTVPPAIEVIPTQSYYDVQQGGNLNINCRSTAGRPEPEITWAKMGDTSEDEIMGSNLQIDVALKEDTGVYVCTGTNVAGTVSEEVSINIRYEPTVEVAEEFIHTAPGQTVQLSCTFSASPPAYIRWLFNNEELKGSTHATIENQMNGDATTSVVRVENLRIEDMGMYKCRGANDWGSTEALIQVSGEPRSLTIVSAEESEFVNQYTLEWTVVSLPALENFTIRLEQTNGSSVSERVISVAGAGSEETDKPSVRRQEYVISELERNTTYRVQLEVHNVVGSIQLTDWFTFYTPADGDVAEPMEEESSPTPTIVSSACRSPVHTAAVLILLTLTVFL